MKKLLTALIIAVILVPSVALADGRGHRRHSHGNNNGALIGMTLFGVMLGSAIIADQNRQRNNYRYRERCWYEFSGHRWNPYTRNYEPVYRQYCN